MATLYDRLISAVAPRVEAVPARTVSGDFRLRPLPNEDVYFFVKKIDNSRVVRKADPKAGSAKLRLCAFMLAFCGLALLLMFPGASSMMAGMTAGKLRAEQDRLKKELRVLDAKEAQLLSASRIEQLARQLQFEDPPPGTLIYLQQLQPKDSSYSSFAMNSYRAEEAASAAR